MVMDMVIQIVNGHGHGHSHGYGDVHEFEKTPGVDRNQWASSGGQDRTW